MEKAAFSWEKFLKMPLVGISRNISFKKVAAILPLYHLAGLTTIEITVNSPGAEDIISWAIENYGDSINIGAGTVCTPDDLDRALKAGARFVVTPVVNEEVIRACAKKGIPVFPGAFTPTEIYTAWSAGADIVKVFPATSLGTDYFRDLKGPMPQIKLMPTGGVSLDNCLDFLKAGAAGLGVGGQLFHKDHIKDENWPALQEHFEQFVKKIRMYQEGL